MPFVSRAQQRWGNSPAGKRALGGQAAVDEWNSATPRGSSVPEKTGMSNNWIGKAVKHPGALTEAAKRNGKSKLEEAESEKHSTNPKIRARGSLGERFIKKQI